MIDDCSTDNSLEKIKYLNDPRLFILKNKKNYGAYITLNIGIKLSRGEFITNQDSDDYSTIDRIEKQVKFLINKKKIICSSYWLRGHKFRTGYEATIMYKRELINKIGYFDSVKFGADSEFVLRYSLFSNKKIDIIEDILCVSSIRNNSLTNNTNTHLKSEQRFRYKNSFIQYHKKIKQTKNFYMPFPQITRLFHINNNLSNNLYIYNKNKLINKELELYISDIGIIIK